MIFDIYRHYDARSAISTYCKATKVSQRRLSIAANVHSSYFSRVMVGKANFSSEQLFLIGQAMELKATEIEFFLLLGEHDASGHHAHKRHLKARIETIQATQSRVSKKLKNTQDLSSDHRQLYYREAITSKIHMHLTADRYRKAPHLIAKVLNISNYKLETELTKLKQLGIISHTQSAGIHVKIPFVHLSETDPWAPDVNINWRLEAIEQIRKREPNPNEYHMSAIFTVDEAALRRIREKFKDFVVSAQKEASVMSSNVDVHVMCFDLF